MEFLKSVFLRSRHTVLYGLLMALLILGLKLLQWKFLIVDHSLDIYVGLIAVFFTALGIWLALQLAKPRIETVVIRREATVPAPGHFVVDETELKKLNLTTREHAVLELLAKGYSNSGIASELFLSLSTVKTHVSNVLLKMDVKSRAQAIEKSKRLKITP
jgi:NarL family two-component system response regulator LiaR